MHTVHAVVDVFVFAQVVDTIHQGLTHHDVTEGNDVGNDCGRNRIQKYIQIRETNAKRQVVPQLVERRLGDPPLHVRHIVFAGGKAHQNGHHHARHHAVVGNLAGQHVLVDKAFERDREHQIQTHQTTHDQGDRRVGQAAAGLDFTHQCRNTGTNNDTALHRARNPVNQFAAQTGHAQNQKDQEHQELQCKQRLDGLRAGFIIGKEQQHHRNTRGNPAGHQRHTQQGWQHKADTADHHVSQGHVVGNTEIFFQQRNHGQTDHKHDQRLHHLREFPAVMDKRQSDFKGTSRPVRLLFTILSVEHLHNDTSRHRISDASLCCFCGEVGCASGAAVQGISSALWPGPSVRTSGFCPLRSLAGR